MPSKQKSKYTLGQTDDLHDLTLPSGATCEARRPGVQGLIAAGVLDNFDQLTSLVQTEHIGPNSPKGPAKITPEDVVKFMGKGDGALHAAFLLMDKLVVYVVTQPELWIDYQMPLNKKGSDGETLMEPEDEWNKRQEAAAKSGAIPVRKIGDDDKMFLLQFAIGGSADLTAFREGSAALMANVEAS